MGERERRDSLKVLEGKKILVSTRQSILDFILYPYRAYKQKKRQEEIRRSMFRIDEEQALEQIETTQEDTTNKGE